MANWIEIENKLSGILNHDYYRQQFGINTAPLTRCLPGESGALPAYVRRDHRD